MRLALLLAAVLGATTAFAAKPALYQDQTTQVVRDLRTRQGATARAVVGAMRTVQRLATVTGQHQKIEVGGLTIGTQNGRDGTLPVAVIAPRALVIASTSEGKVPRPTQALGATILHAVPTLRTGDIDDAVATFLAGHARTR